MQTDPILEMFNQTQVEQVDEKTLKSKAKIAYLASHEDWQEIDKLFDQVKDMFTADVHTYANNEDIAKVHSGAQSAIQLIKDSIDNIIKEIEQYERRSSSEQSGNTGESAT